MASFEDILNQPLPSQTGYTESSDDDMDDLSFLFESDEEEGDVPNGTEEAKEDADPDEAIEGKCGNCDEGIDDELEDPTEMDDDEIADSLEDIVDDDPDFDDSDLDDLEDPDEDDDLDDVDDDEEEELPKKELSPEEDAKANDLMAIAATPLLIKDELTAEESVSFYESADAEVAVNEGLVLESDLDDLFQEGVFASPTQKFKMTKKARYKQLYELSVQIEGRMHNDPMYAKLQKAYKIERLCKKALRQRYHSPAKRRAMIYLKRLSSSKSGVLSKIGKKLGVKK